MSGGRRIGVTVVLATLLCVAGVMLLAVLTNIDVHVHVMGVSFRL